MSSEIEAMSPWDQMTLAQKRTQVAAQYRAVAHMAKALMDVHTQIAPLIAEGIGGVDSILDIQGARSAHIMEVLGDVLNGMDAVDPEEDAWISPVFDEAHRLFPAGATA